MYRDPRTSGSKRLRVTSRASALRLDVTAVMLRARRLIHHRRRRSIIDGERVRVYVFTAVHKELYVKRVGDGLGFSHDPAIEMTANRN